MKHIRKINEFINESEIYSLIEKVENECKYLSDRDKMSKNKSYQDLIKYGNHSIPYLIEKLDDNSAMIWVKALESISNRESVGEIFDEIISDWKKWYNNEFRNRLS
jgi:hypothetical protein